MIEKPPARIGNVSGATGDHPHAMARMIRSGNVQVITGNWLSEMNIAWNAIARRDVDPGLVYENGFYEQLEACVDDVMAGGIRVVTNAGALNTAALFDKVKTLCRARGYPESAVAAVLGDDVSGLLRGRSGRKDLSFPYLDHPETTLDDWGFEPCCGNAYIGCWGIVEALRAGARIVICGRCTDASPDFLPELVDLAFLVAEIARDGGCVISKTTEGGGHVTRHTVTAQLMYELQGHLYLNPDVVADLSDVRVEE
ncbi:hypothetical protein CGRA01v4_02186 [Colletotrichum graminicola]|uniref:Acyclic terpene utilisation N-terminal domain-containing protein n=1 Tax=Colletotrichum graminicola (strain M1.001 / M2 / FGSC 10212) TaxID=645133 RepID=E3Q3Y8_COLGM|nr:uncharacterized protein GLRG_00884 [Colletotrichum graminicola M1.001]EFQ25740.1 hypothetical protein GLRG_00884 [Colletotrichum graminicola M1.001]WDK10907.1 hypothetical protein CGRA01v4_02186 [Colletotrichum graminicola]